MLLELLYGQVANIGHDGSRDTLHGEGAGRTDLPAPKIERTQPQSSSRLEEEQNETMPSHTKEGQRSATATPQDDVTAAAGCC